MLATHSLLAQEIDSVYHNPAEIQEFLLEMQEEYPDWIVVDSIGHSSEFEMPIFMAKLSDNSTDNEPEPALLYIGQIHAEEVVGVELTLALIQSLLEGNEEEAMRARLEGLELYFIPTINPEGLEVVTSGLDFTMRKNCRDNIGDGEFRYSNGAGWDTSGVDLNRNFGLHWNRGDTLFQFRDPPYVYNYYRGPAPFSEPEIHALRDLALQHRFLFSINYHSSRSARNAEIVLAPWNWSSRWPPDRAAIDALGDTLASQIPTADGQGVYLSGNLTQRNGQSPEWFYQKTGTFQYIIEVGQEIQPDSTGMVQIVNDNFDAAFYLMDYALGIRSIPGFGQLGLTVVDAATDEPLECIITIDDDTDPVLEPRRTSTLTGHLEWMLTAGNHSIGIRRFGYRPYYEDEFEVSDGGRTQLRTELESLELYLQEIRVFHAVSGIELDGRIDLTDPNQSIHQLELVEGYGEIDLPYGYYDYTIYTEGYLTTSGSIMVRSDSSHQFDFFPADTMYVDNFTADLDWQRGGNVDEWGMLTIDNRSVLTESMPGEYQQEMDTWLAIDTDIEIDDSHGFALELIHRPYFEPGRDFGYLEYYRSNPGGWVPLETFSQFPAGWDTLRLNLDALPLGPLALRFRVVTDDRVGEDGWLIDKLTIHQTREPYQIGPETLQPSVFSLYSYPNPFNSVTLAVIELNQEQIGEVAIFGATGRRITTIHEGVLSAGSHRYLVDGQAWPSGIYYLRYHSSEVERSIRLTFLK